MEGRQQPATVEATRRGTRTGRRELTGGELAGGRECGRVAEMETNEQQNKPVVHPGLDPVTKKFLPGNKLACGKGNGVRGRTRALALLDEVLMEEDSARKIKEALRGYLDKHPIKFFREIVMPLLPKEAKVEMQAQGQVVWTRIRDAFPEPEGDVIDGEAEEVRSDPV